MNEQKSPVLLIISVLVMGGVCAGLFALRKCGKEELTESAVRGEKTVAGEFDKNKDEKLEPKTTDSSSFQPSEIPMEGEQEQIVRFASPSELVKNLEHGLLGVEDEKQFTELMKKLGVKGMTEEELASLFVKMGKNGVNLKAGNRFDELGELERRKLTRWSLNFKDGSRVMLDLKKAKDGSWKLEKWHPLVEEGSKLEQILEAGNPAQKDSLMVAHSFVKFAINQDFEKAKQLVDSAKMSDVQIAGLCILCDDGGYKLRQPRGVLRSIERKTVAGYEVHIQAADKSTAQFSLLLRRESETEGWRVKELNFSSLLESFLAENGGDSYYTPFVKNPQGGDSIVVYFDFNKKKLSARTERQLYIVANILKLNTKRKITLTGHTDAVGNDRDNKRLSSQRALAVKAYLIAQGVGESQIKTVGFGAHRPRKANVREDGSDNPEGRKANRRTEIYLDF